ncbi:MAG TPA: glycerol-3-phosphate 1-O-acyltransferase PlsY [Candidatus Binatia bacterium]|nr:glycerol-3-phosphate 1-O-acyltransferase PlsY [Candidatus Binatia bacterium]
MGSLLLLLVLAYACGTIPTGVLLARRAGVDVRRAGSGNVGAANVARTAGLGLGLATLAGDAAKGAAPPLAARWLGGSPVIVAAAGLAAVLGHVFPVTSRFAGGKGVATAFGVLLVAAPWAAAVAGTIFVAVVLATRYVSLASMAGAIGTVPAAALLGYPRPTLVAAAAMAALVLSRHADNIRRLVRGAEPRFSLRKRQAAPGN